MHVWRLCVCEVKKHRHNFLREDRLQCKKNRVIENHAYGTILESMLTSEHEDENLIKKRGEERREEERTGVVEVGMIFA